MLLTIYSNIYLFWIIQFGLLSFNRMPFPFLFVLCATFNAVEHPQTSYFLLSLVRAAIKRSLTL